MPKDNQMINRLLTLRLAPTGEGLIFRASSYGDNRPARHYEKVSPASVKRFSRLFFFCYVSGKYHCGAGAHEMGMYMDILKLEGLSHVTD